MKTRRRLIRPEDAQSEIERGSNKQSAKSLVGNIVREANRGCQKTSHQQSYELMPWFRRKQQSQTKKNQDDMNDADERAETTKRQHCRIARSRRIKGRDYQC